MRTYYVIIGSINFFNSKLPDFKEYPQYDISYFLELVKIHDEVKNRGQAFENHADVLIVPNHNYHGIVETAHDRLGPLIEDLTTDQSIVFVHNPPRTLMEYLENQKAQEVIELNPNPEKYTMDINSGEFSNKMMEVSKNIIGQSSAIEEVSKSIWYLSTTDREKPYVILLYGNSSLGKTELVKEIADKFYFGKFYEKHLSMFKNNTYSDYFFGERPNRKSLGYDLLERESNLIFFDEIDKCPEHFYSAFYTLFDNTIFKDTTYDADIKNLFIVATSNYQSEEEIKRNMGLPIYYRIDKFIHFSDFSPNTIYSITMNEIMSRKNEYENRVTPEQIYEVVSPLIKSSGENARTIKQKVQNVIEELLFHEVKETIILQQEV